MKEPPAALLLRHEIDRPACASSASSESGSLELLLILHALEHLLARLLLALKVGRRAIEGDHVLAAERADTVDG